MLQSVYAQNKNEALLNAVANGDIETVEALLSTGPLDTLHNQLFGAVDVNVTDACGRTPLHLAAQQRNIFIAEKLLAAGAKVDATDIYGQMPLHLAAETGYGSIIRTLIDAKANVNAKDKNGNYPLHLAAGKNKQWAVKGLLLSSANIDINATDKNLKTPLHLAAEKGHIESVFELITAGAIFNENCTIYSDGEFRIILNNVLSAMNTNGFTANQLNVLENLRIVAAKNLKPFKGFLKNHIDPQLKPIASAYLQLINKKCVDDLPASSSSAAPILTQANRAKRARANSQNPNTPSCKQRVEAYSKVRESRYGWKV